MAVLDIVLYPDDPLTKKAAPVIEFGPELAKLAEDLYETMAAYEGVGLAGPQVGVSQRIFVVREPEGEAMCLINPELVDLEGSELGEEGCLSIPRVFAMVPRSTRMDVRARDVHGSALNFEACDFLARIIQHEYDHLEGTLFPDRLDILTREVKLREWSEVREQLTAALDEG